MPANSFQVAPEEEMDAATDAIASNATQDQGIHNEAVPSCLVTCFASAQQFGELPLWLEKRWYESVRSGKSPVGTQFLCLGLVSVLLIVLPLLSSGTTSFREAKDICRERVVSAALINVESASGHLLYPQHGMNCMALLASFCGYWTWLVASPHTLIIEAQRLDRTRA